MKLKFILLTALCFVLQSISFFSYAQLAAPGGTIFNSASGNLEFRHNINHGGLQLIRTGSATMKSQISFLHNTTERWSLGIDIASNNNNNFFIHGGTSPKVRLTIGSTGKIGINMPNPTTYPDHLLHVLGGGIWVKETSDASLDNDGPGADLTLESNTGTRLNISSIASEGMINLYTGGTRLSLVRFSPANVSVCIGSVDPVASNAYKLYVEKGILTEKLKIAVKSDAVNWSDFVFDKNYKLMPLCEVEAFVKTNHHLPEIPSAEEVYKDGLDVAQMDAKLLQKIEELTLYMIALKKECDRLKQELEIIKTNK
jgi:hypothetical protein